MKMLYYKTLCLIIVIILTSAPFVITANGENRYVYNGLSDYENISLLRNENEILLVGTSGKSVQIEGVYPYEYSVSLSLDHNVDDYTLCSDILIMVSYLNNSNQTAITLYDISKDRFSYFVLYDLNKYLHAHFAYSDGYVFVATQNGDIETYTKSGKYTDSYKINDIISSFAVDFEHNIYALGRNGAYTISKNGCSKISNIFFNTKCCFISDDVFVDEKGNFYRVNGNISEIATFHCNGFYPSGGAYGKYLLSFNANTVYAIDLNKNIEKSFSLSSDIQQMFMIDDTIVSLTYNAGIPNINFIKFNELKNSSTQNNESKSTSKRYTISSDTYFIDFDNMKVIGIPHSTTVAQLRNNISYDGYTLDLYRYTKDTLLKSGNVGTATTAIFYNDEETYTFELSVIGDITGEGNINSRDKKQMFSYLVGRTDMTGVFLDSANIDDYYDINVADLVLLMRMIE